MKRCRTYRACSTHGDAVVPLLCILSFFDSPYLKHVVLATILPSSWAANSSEGRWRGAAGVQRVFKWSFFRSECCSEEGSSEGE